MAKRAASVSSSASACAREKKKLEGEKKASEREVDKRFAAAFRAATRERHFGLFIFSNFFIPRLLFM